MKQPSHGKKKNSCEAVRGRFLMKIPLSKKERLICVVAVGLSGVGGLRRYQERLRLAIQWAARIRGGLRIAKFKRRLAREVWAAGHLQRAARGLLGRRRFDFLRRSAACLPIQTLWRGCAGRAEVDLRWLQPRAVAIQTAARGFLARKRLGSLAETRDM